MINLRPRKPVHASRDLKQKSPKQILRLSILERKEDDIDESMEILAIEIPRIDDFDDADRDCHYRFLSD